MPALFTLTGISSSRATDTSSLDSSHTEKKSNSEENKLNVLPGGPSGSNVEQTQQYNVGEGSPENLVYGSFDVGGKSRKLRLAKWGDSFDHDYRQQRTHYIPIPEELLEEITK